MSTFHESDAEQAAIEWLQDLPGRQAGWQHIAGPDIAPESPHAERDSFSQVVLVARLRNALLNINPHASEEAIEDAILQVTMPTDPDLLRSNHAFHRMLLDGIRIEVRDHEGNVATEVVNLIDWEHPERNEFLAVNQFTVVENNHNRRPDIVLFVNGMPLVVIELKNPTDEDATAYKAYKQILTYKEEIPSLFTYNAACVVSDGLEARIGTISADWDRYMPWRTIEGLETAPSARSELEVLLKGVFHPQRFLALVRFATVFERDPKGGMIKKMAGYHQFHAVRQALESTIAAVSRDGSRKAGVVWHTQGSGKSLTMAFYTGRVIRAPEMENPTIVVITDRNDLDDQLFATFSNCKELFQQSPERAESRKNLRELLDRPVGGIIFTTMQKFAPDERGDTHPLLNDRRNIVVIADEAHRSQYGFAAKADAMGRITYGMAGYLRQALPNATFIGFTGTPIELKDANTREVFGDYISIYDIEQSVKDKATVPIYYESRLAKLSLDPVVTATLDDEFEEVTEKDELETKERLKTKWAALEAIVGADRRVEQIAADIVEHWEQRQTAMGGKAMVVCMSRRICVELYDALAKLRPQWAEQGIMNVVMTGSATDPISWQKHIRSKLDREKLATRFKDADDPFKLVLVRDMWLTGFDVPSLTTMYLDKPMRGHSLMQAIARVNRVFKDKPGGLVVDYLGLADELKKALADYTASSGKGKPTLDIEEALAVFLEKFGICEDILHDFDWSVWATGTSADRLSLLPAAQEHVLGIEEGPDRFLEACAAMTAAYALCVTHEDANARREDVAFFQAIRAALIKTTARGGREQTAEERDHAIRTLVAKAVAPEGVIDIFVAAGLPKPDISILSDEFLEEVRNMPQRSLAAELLRKLLQDELRTLKRTNLVKSRSFKEMLEQSVAKYHNRAITTAQLIEELIEISRQVREEQSRGESLNMTPQEVAFYDALAENQSAREVMGNENLMRIARILVEQVQSNLSIDWQFREMSRARIRSAVRRVLAKYGYPPDLQESAIETVLRQTELLCEYQLLEK